MENGAENSQNGNGLNTQHSLVGSSKTMDKDELNHIIPPSKKFPQVGTKLNYRVRNQNLPFKYRVYSFNRFFFQNLKYEF